MNINLNKAIAFLLTGMYTSEFEVIDGHKQHPCYCKFEQWLEKHDLIKEEGPEIIKPISHGHEDGTWEMSFDFITDVVDEAMKEESPEDRELAPHVAAVSILSQFPQIYTNDVGRIEDERANKVYSDGMKRGKDELRITIMEVLDDHREDSKISRLIKDIESELKF